MWECALFFFIWRTSGNSCKFWLFFSATLCTLKWDSSGLTISTFSYKALPPGLGELVQAPRWGYDVLSDGRVYIHSLSPSLVPYFVTHSITLLCTKGVSRSMRGSDEARDVSETPPCEVNAASLTYSQRQLCALFLIWRISFIYELRALLCWLFFSQGTVTVISTPK